MKRTHIIIIFSVFLLAVIISLLVCLYIKSVNTKSYDSSYKGITNELLYDVNSGNFIDDEETALAYGTILLNKAFPEYIKHNKKRIKIAPFEMDTEEYGKVWKVYIYEEDVWGDIHVLFKKNGEIIEFDYGM